MSLLKLYITPETSYLQALVKKVLEAHKPAELQVIDVRANPQQAEEDSILVVPMLLYHSNGGPQILIGRFDESQLLNFIDRHPID